MLVPGIEDDYAFIAHDNSHHRFIILPTIREDC